MYDTIIKNEVNGKFYSVSGKGLIEDVSPLIGVSDKDYAVTGKTHVVGKTKFTYYSRKIRATPREAELMLIISKTLDYIEGKPVSINGDKRYALGKNDKEFVSAIKRLVREAIPQ